MSKSKRLEADQIIYDIKYQVAHGIHTFSQCYRECGGSARGGRVCVSCLRSDLSEIVGPDFAENFLVSQKRMENILERILNLAEDGGLASS